MTETDFVPVEAQRYAKLLDWGTHAGLVLLALTFVAYIAGVLPPHVPLEQLPRLWSLPVDEYLRATHSPSGWGWLALSTRGDFANMLGIALLSSCSIPSLLAVMLLFREQGIRVHAAICAALVMVLLLAALGWLGSGH